MAKRLTEEHRRKLSLALKGRPSNHKGKSPSNNLLLMPDKWHRSLHNKIALARREQK